MDYFVNKTVHGMEWKYIIVAKKTVHQTI